MLCIYHKRITRLFCLLVCIALFCTFIPSEASAETGVTNCKVVLRKSANKDSTALQTLDKGEEITVLSTVGNWYRVRYGEYKGYIMTQYVNVAASGKSSSTASVQSQIKSIGSAPGIMRPGDSNSDVKKLQKALKILGYYSGEIDGDYGSGTEKAVINYQRAHKLTADGSAGEKTITSIFGSCSKTSLTTQKPVSAQSAATSVRTGRYPTVSSIAAIGTAPSPTRPGDSGTNVAKLQQALEYLGYYSGTIDGSYGSATTSAVKRLQKKRGMKEDGIAGEATIRVLFGSSATSGGKNTSAKATYKTQVLDWYSDNVTKVIPKGARFTVKDVRSGRSFECKRWSGANHMDAEPRTADDTAILKRIYGGSWSWDRRPILILYNGKVYAASMNGMPHGTSTLSNNFEGHICIHFKNSKTHETQKVDPDHQACVNEAARATW